MQRPSKIIELTGAVAAALLFSACAGNVAQSNLPAAPSMVLDGRTRAAQTVHAAAYGVADRITTCPQERVYVANYYYSDIEIYPKDWSTHPAPCATLTRDTLGPSGLSVDAAGTLYVSNFCCNAISVFPRDARSPSRMIVTAGLPNYAYIGADGTLYSSETVSNQVEVFAPDATTATRTLPVPACYGVATDSKNNLYVVSDVNTGSGFGQVLRFAPGATTGTSLGLNMAGAQGIALTKNDSIVLGDGKIDIFAPGATTATRSFPAIPQFDFKLSRYESKLYVASSTFSGGVAEYAFATGALIGTITAGLLEPDGIAYDPPAP